MYLQMYNKTTAGYVLNKNRSSKSYVSLFKIIPYNQCLSTLDYPIYQDQWIDDCKCPILIYFVKFQNRSFYIAGRFSIKEMLALDQIFKKLSRNKIKQRFNRKSLNWARNLLDTIGNNLFNLMLKIRFLNNLEVFYLYIFTGYQPHHHFRNTFINKCHYKLTRKPYSSQLYFNFKNNHQLEATSLLGPQMGSVLHGIGGLAYGGINLLFSGTNNDPSQTLASWGLDILNLSYNFNLPTIVISLLKILNSVKPIYEFIEPMLEYFKIAMNYVCETSKQALSFFSSKQPSSGLLESTSLVESLSTASEGFSFLNYFDIGKTEVLAAAIASVSLIFGCTIIGTQQYTKETGIINKLTSMFVTVSKGKSGIYALLEMFKDFKNYMTYIITNLISGGNDSVLVQLIGASSILEDETCKKHEFFDYLNFVLDPTNLTVIPKQEMWKKRLIFLIKIIDEIFLGMANYTITIPPETSKFLAQKLVDLKVVRNYLQKNYGQTKPFRFTPMWINLVGISGTGKSQFMPLLADYMVKVLDRKLPNEIPEEANRYYAVNFTDKYLTNYNQQYVVSIDDVFQDKTPLDGRSSALDLISWVSNITYFTNQASLEDKGKPFESKIIISSSNDTRCERTEIICQDALRRRMHVYAELIFDNSPDAVEDLILKRKVKIVIKEFIPSQSSSVTGHYKTVRTCSALEFVKYCVEKYLVWYEKENMLLSTRTADPKVLDTILEETSLISDAKIRYKCWSNQTTPKVFNRKPVEFYTCKCSIHTSWNESYKTYLEYLENIEKDFSDEPLCQLSLSEFRSRKNKIEPEVSSLKYYYELAYNFINNQVVDFLKNNVSKLLFAGIGILIAAKSIGYFTQGQSELESEDDFEPTAAKYVVSKPTRAKNVKVQVGKLNKLQCTGNIMSMANPTADNQVQDLISKLYNSGSVCQLIYVLPNGDRKINVGVRVQGQYLLTNHHFFQNINQGDKFEIVAHTSSNNKIRCTQTYALNRMRRIDDLDAVIYKCDNTISSASDITKHFHQSEGDIHEIKSLIMTAIPDIRIVENVQATPVVRKQEDESYVVNGNTYNVLHSYHANVSVNKGMSGSLLIGCNSRLKNKILGIQTCRNSSDLSGYFRPITSQSILDTIALFNDKSIVIEDTSVILPSTIIGAAPIGGNSLQYLGKIPKTEVISQLSKSKIIPSLIHDEAARTQEPSVLSPFDTRMKEELQGESVIFRAMSGFDESIGTVNTEILDLATLDLKEEYNTFLDYQGCERRPLNELEIVNGIPGFLTRVDMKTSPGYPFVKRRINTNLSGKYEWFEKSQDHPEMYGECYVMRETLKAGLELRESKAKEGIKIPTFAYACLKDETRALDKIQNGKTRVFMTLPMDYNLCIRKYFGAFVACMHACAGVKITSCVGIDAASQWRTLYDKLMAKNTVWEDFDYKNWDQHLHPEFIRKVAEIVNYWYGDDDNSEVGILRKVLLYDLVHTQVIVKDRLFQKSSGQCSGCAITAELNCIVHDLLMYYVWLLVNKDGNRETSLSDYRHFVASIMYGDDIVIAVDPELDILFNGNVIKPYMEELGMHITPGDKVSTTFEAKHPSEILFLKRTFIEEGDYVKAPLRSDIIENIPQWIHECDDKLEATLVNSETALQEAYMHGPIYFNNLKSKLNSRIAAYNKEALKANKTTVLRPLDKHYETFDAKYLNNTFSCAGIPAMLE